MFDLNSFYFYDFLQSQLRTFTYLGFLFIRVRRFSCFLREVLLVIRDLVAFIRFLIRNFIIWLLKNHFWNFLHLFVCHFNFYLLNFFIFSCFCCFHPKFYCLSSSMNLVFSLGIWSMEKSWINYICFYCDCYSSELCLLAWKLMPAVDLNILSNAEFLFILQYL